MKVFNVKAKSRTYPVMVGESLENAQKYIPAGKTVIITDDKVFPFWGHKFPDCPVIKIGQGEKNKTLETMNNIYQSLINKGVDRSWFILGIGGGIVTDITGFAASTYMRGLDFGFVASTLLAQVDASVGGKNGVNFEGYKNMVGVFNQPNFVICDSDLFTTLAEEEFENGFAEILKHGAIYDKNYFEFLEKNYEKALQADKKIMDELVYGSIKIKAKVVSQDEKEKGKRRILNFGHTYGHGIEKAIKLPHGRAVALGMKIAASLSVKMGLLNPESRKRMTALLENLGFTDEVQDPDNVIEALSKDKKKEKSIIKFILLEKLGKAVEKDTSIEELGDFLKNSYT